MGDPDTLHSYSYTPDVAAAFITLGTGQGATGSVWHLPVAPARSTRQIIDDVYTLAGRRPRSFSAGAGALRLVGIVKPAMREYLSTLYQFTDRWVVDDSKFRTAFGVAATPLPDALATTLQWYRDAAAAHSSAVAH
jgi:nucleoside-diphosphate-sugar epimerase